MTKPLSCYVFRRNVTGDGIGGPPAPVQSSPDHAHAVAGHSSPAAPGGGDLRLPSHVDLGGEIVPERGTGEESLSAVEEEEEEEVAVEEEEEEEEGEGEGEEGRGHVEVEPSSSRRKRHKM